MGIKPALDIERHLLYAGVQLQEHPDEYLGNNDPFGEIALGNATDEMNARSHYFSRLLQVMNSGPVKPRFNNFLPDCAAAIAVLWRGVNKTHCTPKEGDKAESAIITDMQTTLATLQADIKRLQDDKGKGSKSFLLAQHTKPSFQGVTKWGKDLKSSINTFLQTFDSLTSIVPVELKLFYLRQQMDPSTVLPLFNDQFDPASPSARSDDAGTLYEQAKAWLITEFDLPENKTQAYAALHSLKQNNRQIALYALDFKRLVRKCATYKLAPSPEIQVFQFNQGLDAKVKAKVMSDPAHGDWDSSQLIAAAKTASKGLSVSKQVSLAALAESDEEDATLSYAGALKRGGKNNFKKNKNSFKDRGKKPFNKKSDKWANANQRSHYDKDVWKQRRTSWGTKVNPKSAPELYALDHFVGKNKEEHPCCILCRTTGHTAGSEKCGFDYSKFSLK
jgi:hypothetical protein